MLTKIDLKDNSFDLWEKLSWIPSKTQLDQMIALQKLISEWNKKVNLTRLIKNEDYWIGQIYDSLWPFKKELNNPGEDNQFIDIGTGCGFPGLALAIALPNTKLTLVDSSSRKTKVIKLITNELGLSPQVSIRNERAEATGRDIECRGIFHIAMARAVAPAPVVAEYLIPLITSDGEAVIYRGKFSNNDRIALNKTLDFLKAKVVKIERTELPANRGVRHQIRLKSNATCPIQYPRKNGIPSKKPLSN